jgi:peptide-methionine (S)-S-oxide reductase
VTRESQDSVARLGPLVGRPSRHLPAGSLRWHRRQGCRSRPKPARPARGRDAEGFRHGVAHPRRGMFLGVQGVFQHVRGIVDAVSGYDGGAASTAQYEVVSTGTTGHAESVRIAYDPHLISYGRLLQIFSVTTDPTQLNQQYPDEGTQCRSEIFAATPEQVRIAKAYITQLNQTQVFPPAIVTKVGQGTGFYPAEAYHQNFLALHPGSPYIVTFDLPKIAAMQKVSPTEFGRIRSGGRVVPEELSFLSQVFLEQFARQTRRLLAAFWR